MNFWYLINIPAWLALLLTVTARLADMGRSEWGVIDHFRRMGYIMAATAFAVMLYTPFSRDSWTFQASTWRGSLLAWAWAVTAITTPGMPPWWDFILGVHRRTDMWKRLSWGGRIAAEWRALCDSFRPRRHRKPMAGPQGKLP